MNLFKTLTAWMLFLFIAALHATFAMGDGTADSGRASVTQSAMGGRGVAKLTLDFNEVTHLVFLREEEKLERDVFTILGSMYPESAIFGHIDDIEQGHADVMKYLLKRYGIRDPNNNDNLGVFTGHTYGNHFTSSYRYLVGMGSLSELDALYVSAYIEELDIIDIMRCPKAIVDRIDGIEDDSQCGMVYTHNPEILNVYYALIEGSKRDLQAYVGAIESVIGEGGYKAQLLPQDQVDAILGRVRSK